MSGRARELKCWLDGIPRGSARALISRDVESARIALVEIARSNQLLLAPADDWLEPPLPEGAILFATLEQDLLDPSELQASVRRAHRLARNTRARLVMIFAAQTATPAALLYGAFWLEDPSREQLVPGHAHPQSPAEQLLARAISRDQELAPLFELNQPIVTSHDHRLIVDLIWRTGGLIIEIDGWTTHGTRAAFVEDRQRDFELALSGYLVLRLTHDEVLAGVDLALEKIRELVRARRG